MRPPRTILRSALKPFQGRSREPACKLDPLRNMFALLREQKWSSMAVATFLPPFSQYRFKPFGTNKIIRGRCQGHTGPLPTASAFRIRLGNVVATLGYPRSGCPVSRALLEGRARHGEDPWHERLRGR